VECRAESVDFVAAEDLLRQVPKAEDRAQREGKGGPKMDRILRRCCIIDL
jgi:hypothetical protein